MAEVDRFRLSSTRESNLGAKKTMPTLEVFIEKNIAMRSSLVFSSLATVSSDA